MICKKLLMMCYVYVMHADLKLGRLLEANAIALYSSKAVYGEDDGVAGIVLTPLIKASRVEFLVSVMGSLNGFYYGFKSYSHGIIWNLNRLKWLLSPIVGTGLCN